MLQPAGAAAAPAATAPLPLRHHDANSPQRSSHPRRETVAQLATRGGSPGGGPSRASSSRASSRWRMAALAPWNNGSEPPSEGPGPGPGGSGSPESLYRHSLAMSAVYCVAYTLVFVVGLIGNSFVIAVVYRSPRMRTVTNFFIVNLAVADVLVIVFCLPATLMSNIFVPWVLGWFMCKTVPYIQGVSVAASVYSLVAVSLDRFLAIWWPLKHHITESRARLMIIGIWFIALTSTSPWLFFFDLVSIYPESPELRLCLEIWPRPEDGSLFFLVGNLLLCYVLPTILISMCYVLIWIKVWRRHIPGDTKDGQNERLRQQSKVKVVKMLIVVVILFVLSWMPLYVIFARLKFGGKIGAWEEELLPIVTPIAQWLGSSNSCINPILYAFFNKKYRRGFRAILESGECCGKLRYYESVTMTSSSTNHRKSSYYVQQQQQQQAMASAAAATRRGQLQQQESNSSSASGASGASSVSFIYRHPQAGV